MTEYLRFQSIVNYRIPIVNGILGSPQIESKWTKEIGAVKKKPKKKVIIPLTAESVAEEIM